MPEWSSYNLGDLFPTDASDIISSSEEVINSVADILSGIGTAAEATGNLITSYLDPIALIVAELRALIQEFVDGQQSAAYILAVPPGPAGRGFTQSTDQFIDVVENSLYDTADPNRPVFSASSGTVGIVLLVGAPTLEALIDSVTALGNLFDISTLKLDGLIEKLFESAALAVHLVGTLGPQTISLSGDISLFPSSGIVKIGEETTTYSGKITGALTGVLVRAEHEPGETVSIVSVNDSTAGTSTTLSGSIIGSGLETEISVESTLGFPRTGSIFIGDEELTYEGKTDTSFLKTFPKADHGSSILVTLGKGSSFHGSPPDWENIVLLQVFAEFGTIVQSLASLSAGLAAASDFGEALAEFGRDLVDKADRIRAKADKVLRALERFAELLNITGVHILTVTGTGGTDSFIDAIRTAEERPDFDESAFTAGVVIMAGAEGAVALSELFGV